MYYINEFIYLCREKKILILRQTDTYRKSKSENNSSVTHPDSYREYSEVDNGSVAQLYSASDFGSEGWGLESLRGHKVIQELHPIRFGAFFMVKPQADNMKEF